MNIYNKHNAFEDVYETPEQRLTRLRNVMDAPPGTKLIYKGRKHSEWFGKEFSKVSNNKKKIEVSQKGCCRRFSANNLITVDDEVGLDLLAKMCDDLDRFNPLLPF